MCFFLQKIDPSSSLEGISCHATRVGATQDLLNSSASMLVILCNVKDGYRGMVMNCRMP